MKARSTTKAPQKPTSRRSGEGDDRTDRTAAIPDEIEGAGERHRAGHEMKHGQRRSERDEEAEDHTAVVVAITGHEEKDTEAEEGGSDSIPPDAEEQRQPRNDRLAQGTGEVEEGQGDEDASDHEDRSPEVVGVSAESVSDPLPKCPSMDRFGCEACVLVLGKSHPARCPGGRTSAMACPARLHGVVFR